MCSEQHPTGFGQGICGVPEGRAKTLKPLANLWNESPKPLTYSVIASIVDRPPSSVLIRKLYRKTNGGGTNRIESSRYHFRACRQKRRSAAGDVIAETIGDPKFSIQLNCAWIPVDPTNQTMRGKGGPSSDLHPVFVIHGYPSLLPPSPTINSRICLGGCLALRETVKHRR